MTAAPKREALNLRIRPEVRGLIDRAAELSGKSRTDFVLDAARRAAEEALLDQTLFSLGPDAYERFVAMLDEPPQANEALRKTLRTPPPWKS